MPFLRNLMLVMLVTIYVYTVIVIMRHGVGLFPVFFGDLFALTWRGQFNLDFAFYLIVSGLWLAWRSGFSTSGIVRGLLASLFGMSFMAPQMIVLIARSDGDMRGLLLGVHANDTRTT